MRTLSLCVLTLIGCGGSVNLRLIESESQVQLSPEVLVFGPDAEGSVSQRSVRLRNVGERVLDVFGASVVGHESFWLDVPIDETRLGPGDEIEAIIRWEAPDASWGEVEGLLRLDADSHLGEVPQVSMRGVVAQAELTANPVDLGSIRADCDIIDTSVVVSNVGTAPAFLEGLELPPMAESFGGLDLPASVSVGAIWTQGLRVSPTEQGRVETRVGVRHGDGVLDVPLVYDAVDGEEMSDRFVQSRRTERPISLLVHLDRSASMDDDVRALRTHMVWLVDQLEAEGREWRLSVVVGHTTACGIGPVASDLDGVLALIDQALTIPDAHLTEAPYQTLDLSLAYMREGQCNADLALDDGVVHLLVVSDEQDQSAWGWRASLDRALAVHPDTVVHAVTGPVPGGCETAEPGYGHVGAAWHTGGATWSICGGWGRILDEFGGEVGAGRRRWRLSQPASGAVEVRLDGVPTSDFRYLTAHQGIELEVAPEPGAVIDVRYRTDAPCDRNEDEG